MPVVGHAVVELRIRDRHPPRGTEFSLQQLGDCSATLRSRKSCPYHRLCSVQTPTQKPRSTFYKYSNHWFASSDEVLCILTHRERQLEVINVTGLLRVDLFAKYEHNNVSVVRGCSVDGCLPSRSTVA